MQYDRVMGEILNFYRTLRLYRFNCGEHSFGNEEESKFDLATCNTWVLTNTDVNLLAGLTPYVLMGVSYSWKMKILQQKDQNRIQTRGITFTAVYFPIDHLVIRKIKSEPNSSSEANFQSLLLEQKGFLSIEFKNLKQQHIIGKMHVDKKGIFYRFSLNLD